MAGNFISRPTKIRDACVNGGFYADDKLYFRDTGIYIQSDADGYLHVVADTAIKLNSPDVITMGAGITVGAEDTTANTIGVVVQLNQADNSTAVATARAVLMYLSSDTAGQTLITAAPSGGVAAGTDGTILVEHTADIVWTALSEADGDIDITLTETANTAAQYLNVVTPDGRVYTSGAINFA